MNLYFFSRHTTFPGVYVYHRPHLGKIKTENTGEECRLETFLRSRVPWETGPSLKEMTDEVGIDLNRFVEAVGADKSDTEMAAEFGVGEKTVTCLKEQFYRKGLGTTVGQD